jgi:hypothetical protein
VESRIAQTLILSGAGGIMEVMRTHGLLKDRPRSKQGRTLQLAIADICSTSTLAFYLVVFTTAIATKLEEVSIQLKTQRSQLIIPVGIQSRLVGTGSSMFNVTENGWDGRNLDVST